MDILNYSVFIFNINAVIRDFNDINLISGFCIFFNLLIMLEKNIYIISDLDLTIWNNIISKFSFILESNIIVVNKNIQNSYIKIVNDCIDKYQFYDIILFDNLHNQSISSDIIYNFICIFDKNQITCDDIKCDNALFDFNNIETFVYNKKFQYIPFYVSSKTKHNSKWNILKKKFPILAQWTENNKSKHEMNNMDKKNICNKIQDDINKSLFCVLYFDKNDINHIGTLIEMGILIGQNKTIFLCGDDIFINEVLFNFKDIINKKYVNNHNLFEVIRSIQYDINPGYIAFKEKLMNILQNN